MLTGTAGGPPLALTLFPLLFPGRFLIDLIPSQIFAGDECDKYMAAAGDTAVVGVEISGAGYMSLIHAATSSLGAAPLFVSENAAALSAFFSHTESKLKI